MEKVRFSCPRCQTIMQTAAEKVGYDVACPHCSHRFGLVEPDLPAKTSTKADIGLDATIGPSVGDKAISGSTNSFGKTSRVFTPTVAPPAFRPVGFQCPYCQTTRTPISRSEVSQVGWLVFVVLLITTCFGCVVGLFIRDNYRQCAQCKIRLG